MLSSLPLLSKKNSKISKVLGSKQATRSKKMRIEKSKQNQEKHQKFNVIGKDYLYHKTCVYIYIYIFLNFLNFSSPSGRDILQDVTCPSRVARYGCGMTNCVLQHVTRSGRVVKQDRARLGATSVPTSLECSTPWPCRVTRLCHAPKHNTAPNILLNMFEPSSPEINTPWLCHPTQPCHAPCLRRVLTTTVASRLPEWSTV